MPTIPDSVIERLTLIQRHLLTMQLTMDTTTRLIDDCFSDPAYQAGSNGNPLQAIIQSHAFTQTSNRLLPAAPVETPVKRKPYKKRGAITDIPEDHRPRQTKQPYSQLPIKTALLEYIKNTPTVRAPEFHNYLLNKGLNLPRQIIHVLLSDLTKKNILKRRELGLYVASPTQLQHFEEYLQQQSTEAKQLGIQTSAA